MQTVMVGFHVLSCAQPTVDISASVLSISFCTVMFLVSSMVFLSSDTCRRNEAPQWPGNRAAAARDGEACERRSGWRTFLAASISISKSPPLSSLILSFIVLRPLQGRFGFCGRQGVCVCDSCSALGTASSFDAWGLFAARLESTLLLRGFVLRLPPYTHRSTLSSVLQFDR